MKGARGMRTRGVEAKGKCEVQPVPVPVRNNSEYHKRFYILLKRPQNLQETIHSWCNALDITDYLYHIAKYAKTQGTKIIPTLSDDFNQSNQIFDKSIFSKDNADEIDLVKFCNFYKVTPKGRDGVPDQLRNMILQRYRENRHKTIFFRIDFEGNSTNVDGIRYN